MEHNVWYILLLFIYYIAYIHCEPRCGSLNSDGYTSPQGDIVLRYGQSLKINCTVYYPLNKTQSLTFKRGTHRLDELVEILDNRTIQLTIKNIPKTRDDTYFCILEEVLPNGSVSESMVCMNTVMVGIPPQNITDFDCLSLNYENLTCSWTAPETYVRTNETLKIIYMRKHEYKCEHINETDDKRSYFYGLKTNPQYRAGHKEFDFKIHMENVFGNLTNTFKIEHFKRVLPNPPENLTSLSVTQHSILLNWLVPSPMQNFPPGLHHRVLYQCEYGDREWHFAALIQNHPKLQNVTFNLEGIPYPHSLCDIRVSIRSAIADDVESMWSNNASITVRTESTIPAEPPRTNVGSFDISTPDYYYIYWQQIGEELKNGDGFKYQVQIEGMPNRTIEVHKANALFDKLPSNRSYTFNIWSKNLHGLSTKKSTVFIPRQMDRVNKPTNFAKKDHGGGFQELSWRRPLLNDGQILTNYTIFWCSNERERPYQCTGNLNWTTVPSDVEQFNHTLSSNKIYQFAISANTINSSSGMVWAECTVIPSGRAKMKSVYFSSLGDTWMVVHWNWEDCSNAYWTNEDEYVIQFCPLKSPKSGQCKEPVSETLKNITIKGPATLGNVTNLIPYTTYMVNVFIKPKDGDELRLQNDGPLYNTTNEGAPSTPPPNVIVTEVTNSSISIAWDELDASERHGKLKAYQIFINDQTREIAPDKTSYKFTDLESFQLYNISIKACTVKCSKNSKPLSVKTQMGSPGEIQQQPVVRFQNTSYITIEWGSPVPPRGGNEYYEVKLKQKNDDFEEIINVTERQYNIHNCNEKGKYDTFYVSVRAVNIMGGKTLKGPWSASLESYCRAKSTFVLYIIITVVIILCLFIFFFLKWSYTKCKIMRDVEVKLPPGLAPVVTETNLVPWTASKHTEDHDRSTAKSADEQMLLLKIKETATTNSESSGCSSGHESVASSMESGHLSNTDSGTDQQVNEELNKTSLRQRYVPNKGSGYVLPPESATTLWGAKPAQPSNYCKVGEPASKMEDSPYVSIDKTFESLTSPKSSTPPTPSSPLILGGDILKTKNPSYVPFNSAESQKIANPGYVVAGFSANSKDVLVPDLLTDATSVEEAPRYVQAADTVSSMKNLDFAWQPPPVDTCLKSGYVSVGDAPPPVKPPLDQNRGYVSHRQFEPKLVKKD